MHIPSSGPGSPVDLVMEKLGLVQHQVDSFLLQYKARFLAQLEKHNVRMT